MASPPFVIVLAPVPGLGGAAWSAESPWTRAWAPPVGSAAGDLVGAAPDALDQAGAIADSARAAWSDPDSSGAACEAAARRYGAGACLLAVPATASPFESADARPAADAALPAFRAVLWQRGQAVAWADFAASAGAGWPETRRAVADWVARSLLGPPAGAADAPVADDADGGGP